MLKRTEDTTLIQVSCESMLGSEGSVIKVPKVQTTHGKAISTYVWAEPCETYQPLFSVNYRIWVFDYSFCFFKMRFLKKHCQEDPKTQPIRPRLGNRLDMQQLWIECLRLRNWKCWFPSLLDIRCYTVVLVVLVVFIRNNLLYIAAYFLCDTSHSSWYWLSHIHGYRITIFISGHHQ